MSLFTCYKFGTPGAIRTHDLWYRKPTLYPAELRVHSVTSHAECT